MQTEPGIIFELDTKAVGEDGQFSGYASVFGETDLGRSDDLTDWDSHWGANQIQD